MIDDDTDLRWRELMRLAQDGDRSAYAALLKEMAPVLRGFCRRRTPTREDADDTVQEILITVHKVRATYDPTRPFRPWLVTLSRRRIADRLALLKRRGPVLELDEARDVTFDDNGQNDPDAGLNAAELHEAVAQLPAGQRQAILLTKLRELSLAEASAESGVSVTALKVATHRAVLSLRRIFARTKDDSGGG